MSKEEFKTFVRSNPILTKYINDGTMTWQKFYDLHSLYGSKHKVWDEYLNNSVSQTKDSKDTKTVNETTTIKDLVGMVKNVDLESVRKGIEGVTKTIALIQEFGSGNKTGNTYTPRPLYQHLDD